MDNAKFSFCPDLPMRTQTTSPRRKEHRIWGPQRLLSFPRSRRGITVDDGHDMSNLFAPLGFHNEYNNRNVNV